MFKSVTSLKFVAQLEDRVRGMAGQKAGACLKVPPEHSWWYYQEFGTAPGYGIFPVTKKALAWTGPDGVHKVVAYVGDHPGVKAKHFVLDSLPDIELQVIKYLGDLGNLIYDAELIQMALETQIMPAAKEIILENVKVQLPGSRAAGGKGESAGKLGGQTAADVLNDVITVEPIS